MRRNVPTADSTVRNYKQENEHVYSKKTDYGWTEAFTIILLIYKAAPVFSNMNNTVFSSEY